MAKLSVDQINELKEKGFITQVIPSTDLSNNTVDELKINELVTVTDPSANIEAAVTHEIPVESISLNETQVVCASGDFDTLVATVLPENTTEPNVTWTCSDPTKFTTFDPSAAPSHTCDYEPGNDSSIETITATAGDKSVTCEFIINPTVTLNEKTLQLHVNDTFQLVATTAPNNLDVTWSSSDPDKVSVSDTGLVTALDLTPDPVEIYASILDDFNSDNCMVTVLDS